MHLAKKSLGQNFLIDKNIIQKIINLVYIKNKNVIEIGPGKGALTEEILKKKPNSLTLIEKDTNLTKELEKKYFKKKNIKIYNTDILKFDIEKASQNNSIIFGNLPYNISTQILVKILRHMKNSPGFDDIILMFQKEVGDKICGKFGSSDYGRLSILTNYKFNIIKKFLVTKNCFLPKPKVTSILIHFKPKRDLFKIKKLENLEKITNIMFSNKRKMVNKNIKKILNQNQIKSLNNFKGNLRPAEIRPETYYEITELYEKR